MEELDRLEGTFMRGLFSKKLRAFSASLIMPSLCTGCGFMPGFGILEAPALYYLPVGEVANQVACEVQGFVAAHSGEVYSGHRWVLSSNDVAVALTLQTDEQGYVNFTGINATSLGFSSLQALVASTTTWLIPLTQVALHVVF